jgi:predicted CDP-diglyceride synthetase/phosphatidate cytidylyltransferase
VGAAVGPLPIQRARTSVTARASSMMMKATKRMLDRLDSVVLAAPVFFHVTRYWWTV